MVSLRTFLYLTFICVKVVYAAPSDGKEIADRFGEDLSFASKQVIRGFTAIIAPLLDFPQGFSKIVPVGGNQAQGVGEVLLRDGVNAFGKGIKASATILSSPARVAGTGLEEIKKVGQAAGLESKPLSGQSQGTSDAAKIASTLLNTTSSQFSQANLGAVLVEVALKKRIKDIGNRTATMVENKMSPGVVAITKREDGKDSTSEVNKEEQEQKTNPSQVDALIEKFNEAVKNNDERVLEALKVVLAKINPPKN